MRAPEFWSGNNLTARFAVAALSPLGWAYGASVRWKAMHARPFRPNAKVICVGNLTAGGTGKTPIAIAIARMLIERGFRVMFLTRGFGGRVKGPAFVNLSRDRAADMGDEALLLAAAAPVIVSRDREAGAKLADHEHADVIVMDDGHQNFSIAKDFSLVVVDAKAGFGNGRVLPAGPLRESVAQGLMRADAVALVGDGSVDLGGFSGPTLRAQLVPVDVHKLGGKAVVAFAGIGRPEKFFETLRGLDARLADARAFADHHVYTAAEIARLKRKAKAEGAILLTTEKDYVRLTPAERDNISFLPVRAGFDDMAAVARLLDRIVPHKIGASA